MAEIKNKVENALHEGRILVLGGQVLLGFGFRVVFEQGFERLPEPTRYLLIASIALSIVAIALLIAPTAYHRIATDGEDTEDLHRFTSRVMMIAVAPFALGRGITLYAATERLMGRDAGLVAGITTTSVALFFWYGLQILLRRRARRKNESNYAAAGDEQHDDDGSKDDGGDDDDMPEKTELTDKIKHVLMEARMVLPGAQALFGFQFAVMIGSSFDDLPHSSKYTHLVSLGLIALTAILLITPAAYHRIVDEGENTDAFHRFASRLVLLAMVPLALGITGDLFVVVRKVSESDSFAIASACVALLLFFGLWFGYTFYRRSLRPTV